MEYSDNISITSVSKDDNVLPNFVIGANVEDIVPPFASTSVGNQHKISTLTESNAISSFFPLSKNNPQQQEHVRNEMKVQCLKKTIEQRETWKVEECNGGRVLETATGENVFIPTLNFESVCSTTECSGDNFNKNAILGGNLLQGIPKGNKILEKLCIF